MADQQQRTSTTTQIRTIYSDGYSFMTIMFFNTSLSFRFAPFQNKDASGKNVYNKQLAATTTVNYEGAFAIFKVATEILEGKDAAKGALLTIPCAGQSSVALERKQGADGKMETWFSISKNNQTIPFKFETQTVKVKKDGQMVDEIIESGLGMFQKTIEGYLVGINADRHLDKLTEDFAKLQQGQGQGRQQFQTGSGFNRGNNNNFKKNNWGNKGGNWGGNRQNQGGGSPPPQPWEQQNQGAQAMSNYTPPQ